MRRETRQDNHAKFSMKRKSFPEVNKTQDAGPPVSTFAPPTTGPSTFSVERVKIVDTRLNLWATILQLLFPPTTTQEGGSKKFGRMQANVRDV